MNKNSGPRTSKEDEKSHNVKFDFKGTCKTCVKYKHTGKDSWHKESANIPKFHYCDKPGTSRRNVRRESGKINQRTTITKITRRNLIIAE